MIVVGAIACTSAQALAQDAEPSTAGEYAQPAKPVTPGPLTSLSQLNSADRSLD